MLFDLRSRGRRTTVRGVYLTLAILMGGGLILFGVGTGVSGGGLLNAFSGGGTSQNQAVSSAERNAEKAVKNNPNSAAAWGSLLQARWTTATGGSGYEPTTGTFTKLGKSELTKLSEAWERYSSLTKSPSAGLAILAAAAYGVLGQYGSAANAWEMVSLGAATSTRAYECLAVTAYAAGQTRKGDLATAKAVSLVPKSQQTQTKLSLTQAKKSPTTAQAIIKETCEA